MPTTCTPRPPHSPDKPSKRGISRRQGAHQVAQKLMTKDLPFQVSIGVDLPSRSPSENRGNRSGILTGWGADSSIRSLGIGGLAAPTGVGMPPARLGAIRLE